MSAPLNYQDTDQDYRKSFESESRKRNLLEEIQEYLAEISTIYAVEGLYKYGKPGQMAFVLKNAIMANDVHDQDEALEILLAFVQAEAEAKRELGEDEYLKSRGMKSTDDQLDEILKIAKANADGVKYVASEDLYLGNVLKERLEGQVKAYRFEQIAKIGRFMEAVKDDTDEEQEKFLKEIERLKNRNEELKQKTSTTLKRGIEKFRQNFKESRRVAKAIHGAVKKLKKENTHKASITRASNFYGSKEGKAAIKEFYHNAQYYSLATRMAMGQQTQRKPSNADKKIAQDCVKNLVMSGSISKEAFLKHMASARIEAAKHVIKNSKSKRVSRKPPTAQKIKSQLKSLSLNYDEMIGAMFELQQKGKLNTQAAKKKTKASASVSPIIKGKASRADEAIKVLREAFDPHSISKELRAKVTRRMQKVKETLRNPELSKEPKNDQKTSSNLEEKTEKLKGSKLSEEKMRKLSKAIEKMKKNRPDDTDPKM